MAIALGASWRASEFLEAFQRTRMARDRSHASTSRALAVRYSVVVVGDSVGLGGVGSTSSIASSPSPPFGVGGGTSDSS